MVAYSFQRRFEMPIVGLAKVGTIRAQGRRRHAQPGDALQLYTGMRTKECRLMARAVCSRNDPIRISFEHEVISIGVYPDVRRIVAIDAAPMPLLDGFARDDGFADWADMKAFWLATHGPDDFRGVWVQWAPESLKVSL